MTPQAASDAAQPFRREAPARELRLDAHARRFAGDVDAHDTRRTRQIVPVAQRERADLAVGSHAEAHPPARAAQPPLHPAVADVDDEDPAHRASSARHARQRSRAPQRDLAGEEARAARAVGQHQRAARIDAGDLAGDGRAVRQQQPHRLALVRVTVLPLGGERREALLRVQVEDRGELGQQRREQPVAVDRRRPATGDATRDR